MDNDRRGLAASHEMADALYHEYAIDPAVGSDESTMRLLASNFGWEPGRLISEFPRKSWRKQLHAAIDRGSSTTMSRKRLVAYAERLINRSLVRRSRGCPPALDWLEATIAAHRSLPFRAIITPSAVTATGAVVPACDCDSHASWWNGGGLIQSGASLVLRAVDLLVECADGRLLLIDPYLDPTGTHWPLVQTAIARLRTLQTPPTLELHTSLRWWESHTHRLLHTEAQNMAAVLVQHVENSLRGRVEPGGLRLVVWHERDGGEHLHNRYVLTRLGGAMFGRGLAHRSGSSTDDVCRLQASQHALRWRQFAQINGDFILLADRLI